MRVYFLFIKLQRSF